MYLHIHASHLSNMEMEGGTFGEDREWGLGRGKARAMLGGERGQHTAGWKESQNSVPRIYAGKKSILKCLSESLKINLTHGLKEKYQDK